jgi:hypothetical protein
LIFAQNPGLNLDLVAKLGFEFALELTAGTIYKLVESLVAGKNMQANSLLPFRAATIACEHDAVGNGGVLKYAAHVLFDTAFTALGDIRCYEDGDFIEWSGMTCHRL